MNNIERALPSFFLSLLPVNPKVNSLNRIMRISLLLVILCSNYWVNAQLQSEFDTLSYDTRMNGSLDSIDISTADYGTTFDGGVSLLSPYGLSTDFLFKNYTSSTFQKNVNWDEMQFSALPHLGFSYSFGGQASQFLKAEYQQSFSDSLILNLRYNRRSGNGSIRNSVFSRDNVQAQLQQLGRFYSYKLKGNYFSAKTNHSDGLFEIDSNITNINDLGLEFINVRKGNANSINKVGDIEFENYFDALVNNSNISVGLITRHQYNIKNRVYNEKSDTLQSIYNWTNIDTTNTRDQFNIASILNGAGAFYLSKFIYADITFGHKYYDYQNLGSHIYINELNIDSKTHINLKNIELKNNLHVNLSGAFNEYSEKLAINGRFGKFRVLTGLEIADLASQINQRFFFGNHSLYYDASTNLQKMTRVNMMISYDLRKDNYVQIFGDVNQISSRYIFNSVNGEWDFINSPISIARLGITSKLTFGVFNLQPRLILSNDTDSFLPKFQGSARVFVKGKLFKAKKLEGVVGVDFNYLNSYKLRTYLPYMDTYSWGNQQVFSKEGYNTSAFVSLGISEFRFFFRFENFSYLWLNKESQVAEAYTIPESRMRIGITWDFFN